jgi:sugar phosphate isomerase/epimerase
MVDFRVGPWNCPATSPDLPMTLVSLAHLTVLDLTPPAMIDLAARTGFDGVGLRLVAVTPTTPGYDLARDKAMMRETKRRVQATGVGVFDIEFVKITPEIDIAGHEAFLAAGAELGARHVVVAPYDQDLERMTERIAQFCDLAAPYGLTVNLEMFPWTVVPNLATATQVMGKVDRPNSGILVDTLHFVRSGSALEELARVPRGWLHFAHICDAVGPTPTTDEGLIFTAREDRLPPGEGEIDIAGILARMPDCIPLGVEVPMQGMMHPDRYEELARRCRDGAARVLAKLALADGGRR